jgi:hypothetical protein
MSSSWVKSEGPVAISVEHMGMEVPVMNVLRQALHCDIPVLAVDKVKTIGYDGKLESETVCHHFGYMPIRRADHGVPAMGDTAVFTVDVVVDANQLAVRWVTTEDVVCVEGDAVPVSYRTDKEAAMAKYDNGYKLCPLLPGQRLKAVATAFAGTARNNPCTPHDPRWCAGHTRVEVLGDRPAPYQKPDGYRITFTTVGGIPPRTAYMVALETVRDRFRKFGRG